MSFFALLFFFFWFLFFFFRMKIEAHKFIQLLTQIQMSIQTENLLPPDSNTNAKTSTVVLGKVSNIIAPSKALWSIDEKSLWSADPYVVHILDPIIRRKQAKIHKIHIWDSSMYLSTYWCGKSCIANITI